MNRRDFLKLAALAASAGALPSRLLAQARQRWQNWSGNLEAHPASIQYPRTEEELAALLRNSSGTVRPFGASHSFSPVVPTDQTLVSLEALAGPRDGTSMTFSGGTRLAMASALAWDAGHSFINEPDINLQSLAGALATSTHGTGTGLPSFSGMVDSLRLVTPRGEALDLSEKDGDLFRAALCSVGALGFVTAIRFRSMPRYRLRETTEVMSLRDAMDAMERDRNRVRHMEMFAFPHGRTAILKRMDITEEQEDLFPADDSGELLEKVCELTMRAPWLTGPIQRMLAWFVEDSVRQGPAWRVFANSRTVRFNEMEYTVPAEKGLECLQRTCDAIAAADDGVFFPIEFRYSAADDSLIGMFSERPGASISVHTWYRQEHWPFFRKVEPVLQACGGRPHWGKLHSLGAAELAALYPRFDRFLALRRELDPEGRMLNEHLGRLFGAPA